MHQAYKDALMNHKGKNITLTIKMGGEDADEKEAKELGIAPPPEDEAKEGHSGEPMEMAQEEAKEPVKSEEEHNDMMAGLKHSLKDDFQGAKGLRAKVRENLMKY